MSRSIDPFWRNRTITLKAASDAPPITEGMRLAVVMGGKREIYEVDSVKKGAGLFDWDLAVTLIETQLPTNVCSCGNDFEGDNFCMPSACQGEE